MLWNNLRKELERGISEVKRKSKTSKEDERQVYDSEYKDIGVYGSFYRLADQIIHIYFKTDWSGERNNDHKETSRMSKVEKCEVNFTL